MSLTREQYAALLDEEEQLPPVISGSRAHMESLYDSLRLGTFKGVRITTFVKVEGVNALSQPSE